MGNRASVSSTSQATPGVARYRQLQGRLVPNIALEQQARTHGILRRPYNPGRLYLQGDNTIDLMPYDSLMDKFIDARMDLMDFRGLAYLRIPSDRRDLVTYDEQQALRWLDTLPADLIDAIQLDNTELLYRAMYRFKQINERTKYIINILLGFAIDNLMEAEYRFIKYLKDGPLTEDDEAALREVKDALSIRHAVLNYYAALLQFNDYLTQLAPGLIHHDELMPAWASVENWFVSDHVLPKLLSSLPTILKNAAAKPHAKITVDAIMVNAPSATYVPLPLRHHRVTLPSSSMNTVINGSPKHSRSSSSHHSSRSHSSHRSMYSPSSSTRSASSQHYRRPSLQHAIRLPSRRRHSHEHRKSHSHSAQQRRTHSA